MSSSRPRVPALVVMAALAASLSHGTPIPGQSQHQADRSNADRSIEHLRLDCASELGRREVTLFANGTVRLREGPPDEIQMWLQELGREEVVSYLNRLIEPGREETEPDYATVGGEWVERCTLWLDLPGREGEQYRFGRYDSLSLGLRRALAIALEVGARVDQTHPPEGVPRLPRSYRAKIGDVLRRIDGYRFRVVGFTWDGSGLELVGIDQPLTLYMPADEVRKRFVELER